MQVKTMDWQTVYRQLTTSTTHDELVDIVLPALGRLLAATQVELYLNRAGPSALTLAGTWGLDDDTAAVRANCALAQHGPAGYVMQRGQPFMTGATLLDSSIEASTERSRALAETLVPSEASFLPNLLYVPLQRAERCLGVLGLGRPSSQQFTPADLAAVQTFAGQVALVLESIALRQEQDRYHLVDLSVVHEVTLLLSSIRDPVTLLTQMATTVRNAFMCFYVAVFRYDPATNELVLVAFDGDRKPPHGIRLAIGQGLAGHAAQQLQPVYAPNVRQDARYFAGVPDVASEVAFPLRRRDRLLGALNVASQHARAFDAQTVQVLESLAHAAALALENAELFAASEQRIQAQALLIQISQALNTASDLETVLDLVLEAGVSLVGERKGTILLLDERANTLRIVASRGIPSEVVAAFNNARLVYTYEGTYAQAVCTGRIVEVLDTATDLYTLRDVGSMPEWAINVPLRIGQRVIGILALDSLPADDQVRELLQALADIAALAIEKTQLLEQAQEEARVSSLLLDVSTTLGALTSLSDVLLATTQAVQQAIPAAQCWLFLRDGEQWRLQLHSGEPEASTGSAYGPAEPSCWPAPPHPLADRLHQMTARREPVALDADETFPSLTGPLAALSSGQTILLTPLVGAEGSVGFLVTARPLSDGPFMPSEMRMITGVVQRATVAIENQQLIGRIQNQLHKSARLYEISTRLHMARQMESLLRSAIEDITRVFAAPAAEILLFDEKGSLELRVATGLSDAVLQETIPRPSGSARTIWRTGQHLIVNDANLAPAMIHPRLRQTGIRALLGLPLRGRERIWGVVRVLFDRPQQFPWDEVDTLATYVNQVAVAIENTRLYQDLEDLLLETIRALVHAFEAKDYYSAQHSEEVMHYAVDLARELGLSEAQCRTIQFGALLHDIGKIGIGDQILLKGTALDTGEWHLMRTHPVIGAEIVKDIGPLRDVIAMIRHHHERFDGLGYPDGLAGEEIPLEARILSVVDAFESMTSDRAYRAALSVDEALNRLETGASRQWDGHIVDVWCAMVRREGQKLLGLKWEQLVKEKTQHKPRPSHVDSPPLVERASLAHLPGEDIGPLPDVVLHRRSPVLSKEKTETRR